MPFFVFWFSCTDRSAPTSTSTWSPPTKDSRYRLTKSCISRFPGGFVFSLQVCVALMRPYFLTLTCSLQFFARGAFFRSRFRRRFLWGLLRAGEFRTGWRVLCTSEPPSRPVSDATPLCPTLSVLSPPVRPQCRSDHPLAVSGVREFIGILVRQPLYGQFFASTPPVPFRVSPESTEAGPKPFWLFSCHRN